MDATNEGGSSTLFTEVLQNINELADTIEKSMAAIMANRSFKDPGSAANHPQLGTQVFASITGVLDEYARQLYHCEICR